MKIKYEKIALDFLILFFKVSCLGCLVYFVYAAIFDESISSITIVQSMIISFLMLKEFQRYKERLEV